MRDILNNKIWIFFLAIAFLSMQSASAHIHLASSHVHDGYDHSHARIIHSHSVTSHHIDSFETELDTHTSQVVELCQDWIMKYWKSLGDIDFLALLSPNFPFFEQATGSQSLFDNPVVCSSFHFLSKVQARAPPTLPL